MREQEEGGEEKQPRNDRLGLCGQERFGRPCMLKRGHDGKHEWRDIGCSIQWK